MRRLARLLVCLVPLHLVALSLSAPLPAATNPDEILKDPALEQRARAARALRELLGNGSLLGVALAPRKPLLFFALPAGGFFSIAILMGFFNWVERKMARGGAAPGKAAAGGAHG